ncbi:hypothetical protein DV702_14195 [Sporosarcina sp. PTS2304]|nr:hypothetical protein DV702_14195 [Sporosarcina sp. PTS2304]
MQGIELMGLERMTYVRLAIGEDDAAIRRSSPFGTRTRKLSSRADGSWGFPPVRVGRCWASEAIPYGHP